MNSHTTAVKGAPPFVHENRFDLAIIGGGVNGTAIARDAAGRGYRVALFESGDLACATSCASTKLIHGGLRYLEYGELRLVKKALAEREVFLKTAPHIVSPMRFVLPLTDGARPAWMIRLGLALYDHLARRDVLPDSRRLDLRADAAGAPLFANMRTGFVYADARVDDARLVVLQAVDAARNGAQIFTRTPVRDLTPDGAGGWDVETETDRRFHARMVVNAAGPWVRRVLERNGLVEGDTPKIRLVRGSHIVVPAIYDGDQAYLLQQPDGRVVFAIPYEGRFTLIGTTDVEHTEGPDVPPACTRDEAEYLCDAVNRFFTRQTLPQMIVWSYSGVRPLFDDGSGRAAAVTRDYHLYRQSVKNAPLLSVYGGKITTARMLAETVTDDVARTLDAAIGPRPPAWTAGVPLPGGELPEGSLYEFTGDLCAMYPWLEAATIERLARAYGTRALRILGGAHHPSDLGRDFGAGLYEAEIAYLCEAEWARTAEDILWRRTKLGLHAGHDTRTLLERHLGEA
ncbi:MAG: glycerol-3-phosphate dehydrogenase [Rhodospirillales bacterium]|nr:glycerol-3-phosphate dehydrogenase [Alphaproteobacteria bacterium]MCB9986240.1 glycerol-3-phosphate dehydrogenase [Rhodospirillales bacterium]USO07205.1 MAG: glycerol-3-phosphate dehydrogenase [Rhodospirillales bacterium]